MKNIFFLVFLEIAFTFGANIPELNDKNFKSTLESHNLVLVIFFASMCENCKNLRPEYLDAANKLKNNQPSIWVFQMDCVTDGIKTCPEQEIDDFPTLKIYRRGVFIEEYTGSRKPYDIVHYLKSLVGPLSIELTSDKKLQKFIHDNLTVIIGVFENGSTFEHTYFRVANQIKNRIKIGHVKSKKVASKIGISEGVVLYRPVHLRNKFENDSYYYTEIGDEVSVFKFISQNFHGLVGVRTPMTAQQFPKPLLVAYYMIDFLKDPKGTNYWRNRMLKVAEKYQNLMNFAISHRLEFMIEIRNFGVYDYDRKKPLVLVYGVNKKKFVMKEPFSVENLDKFVRNVIDGQVVPFVKSEPIPKDNNNPVKVAVAYNFNDLVFNNKKDTIINFYAHWCEHCKKFHPVFHEFGNLLKDENIDVVEMNAENNDVPSKFTITRYPVIYWVPKIDKLKPVEYKGEYELDDLIKFVAKYASDRLKGYERPIDPQRLEDEL